MKFAKELERELVPEWRIKYLNYKNGKKLIKQITKAINKANNTPYSRQLPDRYLDAINSSTGPTPNGTDRNAGEGYASTGAGTTPAAPRAASTSDVPSRPQPIPSRTTVRSSLTENSPRVQYGSFVLTPPNISSTPHPIAAPSTIDEDFALPDPAMRSTSHQDAAPPPPGQPPQPSRPGPGGRGSSALSLTAAPRGLTRQGTLTRLFSGSGRKTAAASASAEPSEISLQAWDQVKKRNEDFVGFLGAELRKVEGFYRMKENQAGGRLDVLREQLHEMRNRRTDELVERKRRRVEGKEGVGGKVEEDDEGGEGERDREGGDEGGGGVRFLDQAQGWIDPIKSKVFRPGPNSKALQKMIRTPVMHAGKSREGAGNEDMTPILLPNPDGRRDYVRRAPEDDVPYRTAKRKLKLALQEFYRGLELLKAYALLNRTAFRKLNKKYDKAVRPRTPYKFMTEHVNKAWFVNSDVLDQHIRTVEDLYARYFERGNHKIAVGKLRTKKGREDESASAFRCGVLLGTGMVFAIQGLISGANILLHDESAGRRADTSYLLQVYGGYFLMLYLFLLFCLDCRQWNRAKVNYPFIFELDPRHHLDWRQLAEFPCFFMLLFGIIFWANFSRYGGDEIYLWWPVVLIGVSFTVLFLPLPVLGHRARSWFVYSHWRLCLAGLYPVEFRDFFLGDIYCSLTYAICNVELFFCLYANAWEDPVQCNSNHSRLMGFLGALPPIWRALQCIRRYYDTRNVFPHLVNCGKYAMTIMSAVTLSMYRVERASSNLALFIAFSTVNGVYASFWDLFMDFSLMQGQSRNFLLRDILAFKRRWWYYGVCVLDPILRFSWIFYAIFTHNVQHSALVSFLVAFAEASRRGMWALFRVENEHAGNVRMYKASRDVPLPYRIEAFVEGDVGVGTTEGSGSLASSGSVIGDATVGSEVSESARTSGAVEEREGTLRRTDTAVTTATATGRDGEASAAPEGRRPSDGPTVRRRRRGTTMASATVRGLGRILAEAHKQDFEKKRRPHPSEEADGKGDADSDGDDDDDDDEDDEQDVEDVVVGEGHTGTVGGSSRGNLDLELGMAGANGGGGSGSARGTIPPGSGTIRTRGGTSVRSSRR